MKFSVSTSDLLRELQLFQGIVERKNTIPILANVLIEGENSGDAVKLAATDLELTLQSRCKAKIQKGGSLTLPAKKLYEILRALPDTEVEFTEPSNGSVSLSADRFSSRIQTQPHEDFPSIPEAPRNTEVRLSAVSLRQMVSKTQFAITSEDTRYFLNGALLLLSESSMSLVATDGHRLALISTDRDGGDEGRELLPKKTLTELGRLVSEKSDVVVYEQGDNHLFFNIDGRLLISRRMDDAQFPAHERVIPKGNDKRIEFESDRLTRAIKRVALLSSERSRAVKFQIDAGKVEISSSSPEVGEASEELSVDYEGAALTICFNPQYVLDFLNAADSEGILLEFKDDSSQAVLSPLTSGGYNYTYVIMPMRI